MPGTHEPISPEYMEMMNSLAAAIDDLFNGKERPKKNGFVLLVFPFGEPVKVNYISNAKREDMLAAMKEFIARAEGRYHETEGVQ